MERIETYKDNPGDERVRENTLSDVLKKFCFRVLSLLGRQPTFGITYQQPSPLVRRVDRQLFPVGVRDQRQLSLKLPLKVASPSHLGVVVAFITRSP